MTDREQTRRDAEQRYGDPYTRIARYEELVEQLDAELEQAERLAQVNAEGFDEHETRADELEAKLEQAVRERDEARHQRDNFERIARKNAENKHELWLLTAYEHQSSDSRSVTE